MLSPSTLTLRGPQNQSELLEFISHTTMKFLTKKKFEQKLASMKTLLNIWYPRNLTLYGRITILKNLALSKLIYNIFMLSFPSSFINTVNQAIKFFIWGKPAKGKHTTMIGP